MFPDKLELVSQELVKLAKDNGSTDNITIVVVFLKPIEELLATNMEAELNTKEQTSNGSSCATMNNNEKEILYDGITSTSIFVGKEAVDLTENQWDDEDAARKISNARYVPNGGNPILTYFFGSFVTATAAMTLQLAPAATPSPAPTAASSTAMSSIPFLE